MPATNEDLDLGPYPGSAGYDQALRLDAIDPLAHFRKRFVITDPDLIYLDGNSLGRLPRGTAELTARVVEDQWGDRLIRSWNEGWWELQLQLGDLLAPLIGAGPGEVIVSDSTSVNLFKLAYAAVKARPGRHKIVTDDLNFPTDVYVLGGVAEMFGEVEVEIIRSDGVNGPVDALTGAIDDDTALVALSHTCFKSGYTYDLAPMTEIAHRAGALTLWDCSHSVGAVPIDLTGAEVDLAVGCTYKYLNGGPGSPAFLYVRPELQELLHNPITAWWAHQDPFAFDLTFQPTRGIRRFHTGSMPTLSLAATETGIRDVAEAGIEAIREKSLALGEFFIELWDSELRPIGFELRSPTDPARRGAHVALGHVDAWPIARAMIEAAAVIPDFRAPDNLRIGLAPLYTTFAEIHTAIQRFRQVVTSGTHTKFMDASFEVT